MKFTEKEIEFAKRLKEAGLTWKPEPGDWFYNKVQEDCFMAVEITDVIKSWYNQSMHDFESRSCVLLPLWHQCKKIIEETGHYLLLLTKGNNVQIDLFSFDKNRFVGVFRGKTDLEVLYQALLSLYS